MTFPLGGPDETPGVIVMCLDGAGLDPRWRRLVVVFNATESEVTEKVEADRLHPELTTSADPLLRTATASDGLVTVPPRSVAVFVADLD